MTKRIEKGRHRAAASASSFEILSRAVASNAGAMGRQAAVVAAASGLVVTLGVSGANATKQDQAAAPAEDMTLNVERTASVKPADIKAEAKAAPIASVKVKATPAPVVEEVEEADEPAASSESGLTEADFAAQVSADGSTAAATAPATSSTAPKKNAEKDTPAPKSASGIAGTALSYKGAPYVWGGTTPSGWDCSGFVRYVYAQNGINLKGRSTHAMLASGQLTRVSNPQPGDLVFQNGNNHVGIYIGGGKIIGAQNPKVGTVIRPANSPYGPLTGYYRVG